MIATLPSVSNEQAHCAVVLAGGNGTRLQSLILKISGDLTCDNYNRGDDAFALTIRSAMAFAEEHPTSLILLGA